MTGTAPRHDVRRLIASGDEEHSALSKVMDADGNAKRKQWRLRWVGKGIPSLKVREEQQA